MPSLQRLPAMCEVQKKDKVLKIGYLGTFYDFMLFYRETGTSLPYFHLRITVSKKGSQILGGYGLEARCILGYYREAFLFR